ncbi:MAG: hydantoinase/oxoprolinase family protein [Candidatus Tectomicrobia bacterium]|nr:hydantoinase/oxoprolinase family protein [Candidatus Tectomicrobia bacterium]
MKKIGIDIGGTFTDLVMTDGDSSLTLKVPSTPNNPGAAAIQALQQLHDTHGVDLTAIDALSHGTTVATNALLQRRGGKTALVTTAGFRDVLEIARLGRPPQAIYDVHYQQPEPLIPRQLRLEVDERVNYRGDVETPLQPDTVRELAEYLRQQDVESVAICFLYSFLYPAHEQRVQEILQDMLPDVPVLCSSDILPERREYERTSTTAISAYLAPTVTRYIEQMVTQLHTLGVTRQLYIMQSNGGLNTPQTATANPGSLLLSGPAAGVAAAARVGVQAGFPHAISIDMGGTSFDVALIQDGQCLLSTETRLDEAAFHVPMLDITTIGAGGGSIAWLDNANKLHVGPQSAGAQPGPACYHQGGEMPTVTDANLLLGFLNADRFLGGAMTIQPALAETAVQRQVAEPLGLPVLQAAAGIARIVSANMAGATRLVSVEKGHDPRDFALLAFGGAGPLHAVAIAEELDIPWVVVPRYPGMTSAAGLVLADIVHNFVQTAVTDLSHVTAHRLTQGFDTLQQRADRALETDGVPPTSRRYDRSLDVKYVGQGYTLNIPLPEGTIGPQTVEVLTERFHVQHDAAYGFRADEEPVEMINLRLRATGFLDKATPMPQPIGPRDPAPAYCGERSAWVEDRQSLHPYQLYDRTRLATGHVLMGPAIVEQVDSTTVIPPGWLGTVDGYSNIIIGTEEWQSHVGG